MKKDFNSSVVNFWVNAFCFSCPCIRVNAVGEAKLKVLLLRTCKERRIPCKIPWKHSYPLVFKGRRQKRRYLKNTMHCDWYDGRMRHIPFSEEYCSIFSIINSQQLFKICERFHIRCCESRESKTKSLLKLPSLA